MQTAVEVVLTGASASVRAFYSAVSYRNPLQDADRIFAAIADGEVIGAVRLCREEGVLVLRGMEVAPAWQRRGVGTLLLTNLVAALGAEPCYCIPFAHLTEFYESGGFRGIDPPVAPRFLRDRLLEYLDRRPDFILMVRPAGLDHHERG